VQIGATTSAPHGEATIRIVRTDAQITITVEGYINPALTNVSGDLTDWRCMIDEILIDPAYDGRLFRPTIVDAPQRRSALVSGVYTLDRHATGALLAVKIIDVTGGEAWMVMLTDGETLTF
jgi:hypothetical protein